MKSGALRMAREWRPGDAMRLRCIFCAQVFIVDGDDRSITLGTDPES